MNESLVQEFRALLTGRFGWRLDDDRGSLAQLLTSRLRPQQSATAYIDVVA